jgi:hypothetical protein
MDMHKDINIGDIGADKQQWEMLNQLKKDNDLLANQNNIPL